MANPSSKPKKKRMTDISRRVPVKPKEPEIKPLKDKKPEPKIIAVQERIKKLDKEIEQFEKKEEKRFKREEKARRRFRIRKLKIKTYILIASILVLLAALVYSALEFLPRTDIKITTKKTEWNYVESITANKNITQIGIAEKQMSAETFSLTKNFTASFAATGKKMVEQKASGKITIYNAYSSKSQPLVATTRFAAPDGKIFRLTEKIIVPGAKIEEGKIVPSSIEATVVADKAGPDYNIGAVSHFSIPGFQGSAKYQGFYAESGASMSGGFIGEIAYPTDNDIEEAKARAASDLQDYIMSLLAVQIPTDFKIIEGARQFSLLKQEIDPQADANNNFNVFSEAQLTVIAFRESDVENLMEETAKTKLGDNFRIKTYELDYGAGRSDFKQGQVSFAVDFHGSFEEPVDADWFREQAVNKSEQDLRVLISSLPNIQKITISFWPFWVKRSPDDLDRIKVSVE